MSYKVMFILNALVALVFGVGFLFVPSMALGLFGTEARVAERLVAQFFGTAMLALGLVLWFAKDVTDEGVQRGMGISLLVGALSGLVVTVIGVASSGVIRNNGWIAIVLYALFGLGYAYMVFLKPRMMR